MFKFLSLFFPNSLSLFIIDFKLYLPDSWRLLLLSSLGFIERSDVLWLSDERRDAKAGSCG
jgi:hypothetical protein